MGVVKGSGKIVKDVKMCRVPASLHSECEHAIALHSVMSDPKEPGWYCLDCGADLDDIVNLDTWGASMAAVNPIVIDELDKDVKPN